MRFFAFFERGEASIPVSRQVYVSGALTNVRSCSGVSARGISPSSKTIEAVNQLAGGLPGVERPTNSLAVMRAVDNLMMPKAARKSPKLHEPSSHWCISSIQRDPMTKGTELELAPAKRCRIQVVIMYKLIRHRNRAIN